MHDQLSAVNTKGDQTQTVGTFNLPAIGVNMAKAVLIYFGKKFLKDPIWTTYDAIIDTNSLKAGNYPSNDDNLEHVVRTAKVFVADHYEKSNLIQDMPGNVIEGTTVSVTTLPWQEAKLFRIGEIIQEYAPIKSKMMFPDFNAIESFLKGRSRCAGEFFAQMDARSAMLLNETDGSPLPTAAWRYTYPVGCPAPEEVENAIFISPYGPSKREKQYLPTQWAESTYIPPYEMEKQGISAMPLEAITDIERYSEEEICTLKVWKYMHMYAFT